MGTAISCQWLLSVQNAEMKRPNFLILLTDDQGYGDAGCYGSTDLQTPNFDRLAAEGCRFTQWYGAAPVCSASRAGLLTGRFPWSVGVPGNVSAAWNARGLRTDVITLPQYLRQAGYRTYMSGKWHLGQQPDEQPHRRGFDNWFGFLYGCIDYYSHVFYWLMSDGGLPPRHDLWQDGREIYRNGQYITDMIADQAIAYLRQARDSGQPFFLYVPFNNPHYPMQAPQEVVERFAHLPEDRKWTAALMYTYDQALGRILNALDELGLADNTVVFASADHGPSRESRNWPDGRTDEVYRGGSTGGLRGAKFSLFEGGIRLPALMRWPGVIQPGSVCDAIAHHADILTTFAAAAGVTLDDPQLEGGDLQPVLTGDAKHVHRRRDLCWSYGTQRAIRRGEWKLIRNARDVDPQDGNGEEGDRLYNLQEDPSERKDLRAEHPDLAKELASVMAKTTAME